MPVGIRFRETMAGSWRPAGPGRSDGSGDEEDSGAAAGGPIRFDLAIELPEAPGLRNSVTGTLAGTLDCAGLATAALATGTIEVSPVLDRRIRYQIEVAADDGRRCRFDGWKSIDWLHPLSTWTTLPGSLYGPGDELLGTASLRFAARALPPFLTSMRPSLVAPPLADGAAVHRRRWDGRPGRLEVWYDTFTDPATGAGFWLHHELRAPSDGSPAEAHGWAAAFPPDGPPEWDRFGPVEVEEGEHFAAGEVIAEPGVRRGAAGEIAWDLSYEDAGPPLFAFPALAWRRELLPAAHAVPFPQARYTGSVRASGRTWPLVAAPGASARLYGKGNAARWAWLHADLGGGDLLEVVAAVPHRAGFDRLPPLPLVRLRYAGREWPKSPMAAASRSCCEPALPSWTVTGRAGRRRLRATVTLPPERCVEIGYVDPDGGTATCTNSERADASVVLEEVSGGSWRVEREWRLDGTAHAEVGTRP